MAKCSEKSKFIINQYFLNITKKWNRKMEFRQTFNPSTLILLFIWSNKDYSITVESGQSHLQTTFTYVSKTADVTFC